MAGRFRLQFVRMVPLPERALRGGERDVHPRHRDRSAAPEGAAQPGAAEGAGILAEEFPDAGRPGAGSGPGWMVLKQPDK